MDSKREACGGYFIYILEVLPRYLSGYLGVLVQNSGLRTERAITICVTAPCHVQCEYEGVKVGLLFYYDYWIISRRNLVLR